MIGFEMKNCPVCGDEVEMDVSDSGIFSFKHIHKFDCIFSYLEPDCFVSVDSAKKFIDTWNNRPEEDRLTAKIAELESRLATVLLQANSVINAFIEEQWKEEH